MRGVKRFFLVAAVFFAALFVLVFVLENQQSASLTFLGWSTAQLPISVFVALALILGMLAGPVLTLLIGRRRPRAKV
ncbi:hypothetical protein [Pseudomonas sp. BIGb0164]|uniref:hypothetical protein n=1 Tax=Pseudomonas sp. BIGb0164 TaxID=2940605 RepID=UPI0021670BB9|nr:hypothetical protein [Pseudomonas sp. BIGb0164]MCS4249294.1 putative integral membrane protein [Pseudomonas sp. BIGb0164]